MLRKFIQELDQDILMNMTMLGPPWLFLDSVITPKGEVQRVDKDHRPREREDGSPGPYLLSEVPTLCNAADSVHRTGQPLLLV